MTTQEAETDLLDRLTNEETRLLRLAAMATGQHPQQARRAAIERYADAIADGGPYVIAAPARQITTAPPVQPDPDPAPEVEVDVSPTVDSAADDDDDDTVPDPTGGMTIHSGDDAIAEAVLTVVQGQGDQVRYTCRQLADAIDFHSTPDGKADRPAVSMYQWLSTRMGVPLRKDEQQGAPRYVTVRDLRDWLTPCPDGDDA